MVMTEVDSSCLTAFGENVEKQFIDVVFHTGVIYRYHSIPQEVVSGMRDAAQKGESVGKYFCKHIRNNYQYKKLN